MIREEAPTNNAGGGNIAGIGVGSQGEPGMSKAKMLKRKTYKEFMNARNRS